MLCRCRALLVASAILPLSMATDGHLREKTAPRIIMTAREPLRIILTASEPPRALMRVTALRGGGSAPKPADAAGLASAVALHGLCLAGCGYAAGSSLGMGAAAALLASAGLTVSGNFPAYMAGVHVALLLQAGSAGVFGVQAARAGLARLQSMNGLADKLLPYTAMSLSSAIVLGKMKQLKPKKSQ